MSSTELKPESDLCRYVRPHQHDGEYVDGGAFHLRKDKDEEALSSNLLDFHHGEDRVERLNDFYHSGMGLRPQKNGGYAIHVHEPMVTGFKKECGSSIEVEFDGKDKGSSHCSIYGLKELDEIMAGDALADLIDEFVTVKELK